MQSKGTITDKKLLNNHKGYLSCFLNTLDDNNACYCNYILKENEYVFENIDLDKNIEWIDDIFKKFPEKYSKQNKICYDYLVNTIKNNLLSKYIVSIKIEYLENNIICIKLTYIANKITQIAYNIENKINQDGKIIYDFIGYNTEAKPYFFIFPIPEKMSYIFL